MYKFKEEYRNGGDGFVLFCEDNLCVPMTKEFSQAWCPLSELPDIQNSETGRSYQDFWNNLKTIARECLRMEDGVFIYVLIILCWMRGEGKTTLICLILIWKRVCFDNQNIALCSTREEDMLFGHYSSIKAIVENSPNLSQIQDDILSGMIKVTSFTGVISNISAYSFINFSETKNYKLFEGIDASTCNIENSFGILDTNVSEKNHPLFTLYKEALGNENSRIYFSYRWSPYGLSDDWWHPLMTQKALNRFKILHAPEQGFDRFFKNTWDIK